MTLQFHDYVTSQTSSIEIESRIKLGGDVMLIKTNEKKTKKN